MVEDEYPRPAGGTPGSGPASGAGPTPPAGRPPGTPAPVGAAGRGLNPPPGAPPGTPGGTPPGAPPPPGPGSSAGAGSTPPVGARPGGPGPSVGSRPAGTTPPRAHSSVRPSIGTLLGKVTEDFSALIRDEIQLAQAQFAAKGKAMGMGAGMFAGAAVFGLFAFGWLLTAGMFGLATVMPFWAASLIVAGVLLVITLILALIGRSKLKGAPSPTTGENIKKDVEAVKQGVKS